MNLRVMCVAMMMFGLAACRAEGLRIHVTYERLFGVAADDPVLFQQNRVGRVSAIQYLQDGTYQVTLTIDNGFANALTEFSSFHVVADPTRQGRKAIDIRLAHTGGKLLVDGATVVGVAPAKGLAGRLHEDLEAGVDFILAQIHKIRQDLRTFSESEAYQVLKQAMEDLVDELHRAEEKSREKMKRHWLPELERRLDELRKHLRRQGKEEAMEPLEERLEQIRRI